MSNNQDYFILAPSSSAMTRLSHQVSLGAHARLLLAKGKLPIVYQLCKNGAPSDVFHPTAPYAGTLLKEVTLDEILESYTDKSRYVQFVNKAGGVKHATPLSREFNPHTLVSELYPHVLNYYSILYTAYECMSAESTSITSREKNLPYYKSLSNVIDCFAHQLNTMLFNAYTSTVEAFLLADHRKVSANIYYNVGCNVNTNQFLHSNPGIYAYNKERHTYRYTLALYVDLFTYIKLHLKSLIECCLQQEDERSTMQDKCVNMTRRCASLKYYILELQKASEAIVDTLYKIVFADMDIVKYLEDSNVTFDTHVCTLLPALFHYYLTGNFTSQRLAVLLRNANPTTNIPDCESPGVVIKSDILADLMGDSIQVGSPRDTFRTIAPHTGNTDPTFGYKLGDRMRYSWPLVTSFDNSMTMSSNDYLYGNSNLLGFVKRNIAKSRNDERSELDNVNNRLAAVEFDINIEMVHMWLTAVYLTSFLQLDFAFTTFYLMSNRNLRYSMAMSEVYHLPDKAKRLNVVRVRKHSAELHVKTKLGVELYAIKSAVQARDN